MVVVKKKKKKKTATQARVKFNEGLPSLSLFFFIFFVGEAIFKRTLMKNQKIPKNSSFSQNRRTVSIPKITMATTRGQKTMKKESRKRVVVVLLFGRRRRRRWEEEDSSSSSLSSSSSSATSTKLFLFSFPSIFFPLLMASFSNSIAENIPKAFGTITLLWFGRGGFLGSGGDGEASNDGKQQQQQQQQQPSRVTSKKGDSDEHDEKKSLDW